MYNSPSHAAHSTHHSMHNITPLQPYHNTSSTFQPQHANNSHNQQHTYTPRYNNTPMHNTAHGIFPGICYNCNKTGHTRRECMAPPTYQSFNNYPHPNPYPPTRPHPPTRSHPPSIPYMERSCLIHPNSNHKNIDCGSQRYPCPAHGGHSLSHCRSLETPNPPYPSRPHPNSHGQQTPSGNTYSHTFSHSGQPNNNPRPSHPSPQGVHGINFLEDAFANLFNYYARQ